jgi:hypothetical protein
MPKIFSGLKPLRADGSRATHPIWLILGGFAHCCKALR